MGWMQISRRPWRKNPHKEKKKTSETRSFWAPTRCQTAKQHLEQTVLALYCKKHSDPFFPLPDIHRNGHKNQPGPHDIKSLFLNKCGSQGQNLAGAVGPEVISIFHQCPIQANHKTLTVEAYRLPQDPACLTTPHKEETRWRLPYKAWPWSCKIISAMAACTGSALTSVAKEKAQTGCRHSS